MAGGRRFGHSCRHACSRSGAHGCRALRFWHAAVHFIPLRQDVRRRQPGNRHRGQRRGCGQGRRVRECKAMRGTGCGATKILPPAEQERALQNDPGFRRLPPARQQLLRQRLQHFSSLPPQQQLRMLNRMETWEHLTPEQKQQARQIYGQMRQLPPDRQRMVTTAVRDLRAMPPDQRERIIDSPRFRRHVLRPGARDDARGHAFAARAGGGWGEAVGVGLSSRCAVSGRCLSGPRHAPPGRARLCRGVRR